MTSTFDINGVPIGEGLSYIIAEIGLNHNGQLHLAKAMIDTARSAGVNAVKFQKRTLKSVYLKRYLDDPNLGEQSVGYLLPILKDFELSDEEFEEIIDYCRSQQITFLCSPWDPESADFLNDRGLPAFKTSSADLLNFDLLEHLVQFDKPLILSTGMSTLSEIDATVDFLKSQNARFALLHCNSTYPAPFHQINLNFIKTLRDRYDVIVGYSGHEHGIAVSTSAASMGAAIIERHFTMDRAMRGPDHAASLEPAGLKKLVRDIRNVELAMGSSRKWVSRGEIVNREVLGKSLVCKRPIKHGETIGRGDIIARSPARGVSPQRLFDLVGQKAKRNIDADSYFSVTDFDVEATGKFDVRTNIKWGFPARFSDIDALYDPRINFYEFHLTDGDIEHKVTLQKTYDCRVAVHAPEYWKDDLIDLCSSNPRVREMSADIISRSLDLARDIRRFFPAMGDDPIPVVVHPGGMSLEVEIPDHEKLYNRLADSIQSLDTQGVDLMLENMPPLPWYFGGQWIHNVFLDAGEIADFANRLGMGICFDLSHAALVANEKHTDLVEDIKTLLPLTRHIHIADAASWDGEGLQIGEGEIDFAGVMPLLVERNLPMLLEIWLGHKFGGEGFWRALAMLENMVEGID
jgi:sialic acid synthase SpsE/sugar phosphate isomerase/epimerase